LPPPPLAMPPDAGRPLATLPSRRDRPKLVDTDETACKHGQS